jgi:hypothetical protein
VSLAHYNRPSDDDLVGTDFIRIETLLTPGRSWRTATGPRIEHLGRKITTSAATPGTICGI